MTANEFETDSNNHGARNRLCTSPNHIGVIMHNTSHDFGTYSGRQSDSCKPKLSSSNYEINMSCNRSTTKPILPMNNHCVYKQKNFSSDNHLSTAAMRQESMETKHGRPYATTSTESIPPPPAEFSTSSPNSGQFYWGKSLISRRAQAEGGCLFPKVYFLICKVLNYICSFAIESQFLPLKQHALALSSFNEY